VTEKNLRHGIFVKSSRNFYQKEVQSWRAPPGPQTVSKSQKKKKLSFPPWEDRSSCHSSLCVNLSLCLFVYLCIGSTSESSSVSMSFSVCACVSVLACRTCGQFAVRSTVSARLRPVCGSYMCKSTTHTQKIRVKHIHRTTLLRIVPFTVGSSRYNHPLPGPAPF